MKDLNLIQKYLICAVNEKGKLTSFSIEKGICFLAGGLLQLQLDECIAVEKKLITVTAPLPEKSSNLKPLYDYLNKPKPVKLEKLLEAYHFSFGNKRVCELLDSVGASLAEMGLSETTKAGLFSGRKGCLPKEETITGVVDQMRAELLEEGEVTEDTLALTALLEKSGLLKGYFSKFEQKQLKGRLAEIKNSKTAMLIRQMVDYIELLITVCS